MIEQNALMMYRLYPLVAAIALIVIYWWFRGSEIAKSSRGGLWTLWVILIKWSFVVGAVFFIYIWFVSMQPGLTVTSYSPAAFDLVSGTATPFLTHLRMVSVERNGMWRLVLGDNTMSGMYHALDRSISLRGDVLNVRTWYHEIGHLVESEYLTQNQRDEWGVLHQEMVDTGGVFPSEYACANDQEDWAESFSLYVVHGGDSIDSRRRELVERAIERISPSMTPECRPSAFNLSTDLSRCVWKNKQTLREVRNETVAAVIS